MNYTVKNKKHEQDNINFINFDIKRNFPSFLDYDEVLKFSIESNCIENEADIISLCDGGDHIQPYFSSNPAADECQMYVENKEFEVQKENGEYKTTSIEFDVNVQDYELFDNYNPNNYIL